MSARSPFFAQPICDPTLLEILMVDPDSGEDLPEGPDNVCGIWMMHGLNCGTTWDSKCENDNPWGGEFNSIKLGETGCSVCAVEDDPGYPGVDYNLAISGMFGGGSCASVAADDLCNGHPFIPYACPDSCPSDIDLMDYESDNDGVLSSGYPGTTCSMLTADACGVLIHSAISRSELNNP